MDISPAYSGIICLIYGIFFLLSTGSYIYATCLGKCQVWTEILAQLKLQGDEQVLDMGCGRGAILLMAASFLSTGKATGIDLWLSRDQSGNALEVTRHNAELEGVGEHIELLTADMRKVPFPDNSFDVMLSSLAIHTISDPDGRKKAIDEAVRVLKPRGRLAIADIRHTTAYTQRLQELSMLEVQHRMLDWRFWYGGPWYATKLISAHKPAE